MTEQTGPNPEVQQDVPAAQVSVDQRPDVAAVMPDHEPSGADASPATFSPEPVAATFGPEPTATEPVQMPETVEPALLNPEPTATEPAEVPETVVPALLNPEPTATEPVQMPETVVPALLNPEPTATEPAEVPETVVPPAEKPVRAKAKAAKGPSSKARKAAAAVPAILSDVPKSENMDWYILKVQSNREESIREGLLRRVSIQGLDRYFGEIIVPTEKVTEFKGGKKRVIKRKLYPGYIVVHMEINEDSWFLVRETPGIGDFTGASGKPTPMLPHEVERIIAKQEEKSEKAPDLKIPFTKGDRVKIIEGNFENFEGEVDVIDKTNGRVTVMITIFNRTTPVEFEYWQVESV